VSHMLEERGASCYWYCWLLSHSVQHLNAGFTVLLDAHSSKTHSSTKHILDRMAVSDAGGEREGGEREGTE